MKAHETKEKELLKALIETEVHGKRVVVGKYAHDCACNLTELEGDMCDKVYLDAYHEKDTHAN